MIFQNNIVAGGHDGSNYLDSVEVNVVGENNWTPGSSLTKPLYGLRGVTAMSLFYLTGELYTDTVVKL